MLAKQIILGGKIGRVPDAGDVEDTADQPRCLPAPVCIDVQMRTFFLLDRWCLFADELLGIPPRVHGPG